MPTVSIIVPVYKAEKYLHRCIDSILSQTFTDWECILVDDGSPDRSGAICDEYAQKDNRIRVIHKENGGVSSARNVGINNAQGIYITFVDSDDWIEKTCLETCSKEMDDNRLDLLQFGYKRIASSEKILIEVPLGTPVVGKEKYIELQKFNVCVGGGMYRLDIIQKRHLRFEIGMKLGEDQKFFFEFLMYADRIRSLHQTFYYYFLNYDSATVRARSCDIIKSMDILGDFVRKYPLAKSHFSNVFNSFLYDLLKNCDMKAIEYKKIFDCYFDPTVANKLILYSKLSIVSPAMAFYVCGIKSFCYYRIRTYLGSLLHKIDKYGK